MQMSWGKGMGEYEKAELGSMAGVQRATQLGME